MDKILFINGSTEKRAMFVNCNFNRLSIVLVLMNNVVLIYGVH